MNGHVLYYPFFLPITYIRYSSQFESIQFLQPRSYDIPTTFWNHPPLYKKTHNPEQTFTLHPSIRHNRVKIQTRPNPPISERASGGREAKGADKLPEQTRRISSSY